jgi:predicted lipid-binding transport protein (Tim44 family)
MGRNVRVLALLVLMSLAMGSAWAAEPFIYPTKGQSPEQMEKDKAECYIWAKQQSGFDPMQAPAAAPAPPPSGLQHEGQVVGGAARGAALGAIGGAIAGDAGKGAAIGAVAGGGVGAMRKRSDYRNQQEQYQQQVAAQQADYQQKRGLYDRAFSACMEGRNYTLK